MSQAVTSPESKPDLASQPADGGAAEALAAKEDTAAADKKKGRRDRTVEVAFRVAYREQLELTALADSKANIMIHINGLILSIVLASSGFIQTARPWLQLPLAVLAVTAMTSLLLAVLAARPKLRKPPNIDLEEVRSGRANILFFGNFGRLSEDEFVLAMNEMFEDSERIYLNMTRHIHGMGHVLLRKFRLLRVSYTVFLVGLLVSGVLFLMTLLASSGGAG